MGWNEQDLPSSGKSKTITTAGKSSRSTGRRSPVTTTSPPSTGDTSHEWTFCAEVHPASPSPLSGSVSVHQICGISGQKLYRRLELYAHSGSFLKMLLGWSSTLPRASSLSWRTRDIPIRHGGKSFRSIYRLALSAPRISVSAFGLLPTLKASDGSKGIRTPEGTAKERLRRKNGLDLPTIIGGRVHPAFAEWMFGYPIGHTELDRSGTVSSPKLRKRSGG